MALMLGGKLPFGERREFCAKLGSTLISEIHSDYHGQDDRVVVAESGLLTGSVHHLERGEPVADRPTVRTLAQFLVELVSKELGS
jgi:CRISPR-associated protein Csx3